MRALDLCALFIVASCSSSCSGARAAPAAAPSGATSTETAGAVDPIEGEEADGSEEGEDPNADALVSRQPTSTPDAATAGDAVLAEASRIFSSARSTTYQHHTSVDEVTGTFDVDCSGFVGYVLGRVAPAARTELQAATAKRPRAKDFTEFFASLPADGADAPRAPSAPRAHWRRVVRAVDLRPGDIVAWKRPADSRSKNTGHTLIVRAPITVRADFVEVPIYDSTGRRHGKSDVRAAGSRSGVGEGAIALRVSSSGAPIAFRWAVTGRYRDHPTDIALGRVEH
jgi:hypothetical protein